MAYKRCRVESSHASHSARSPSQSSRPPSAYSHSHHSYNSTLRSRPLSTPSVSHHGSVLQSTPSSAPSLPRLPPSRSQPSCRPIPQQTITATPRRSQNDQRHRFAEGDDEIEARESMDSINETIMAIDMREYGTIGCAYYVAKDEKLYLMEDIKMGSVDLVDTLKIHASPTIILINTKSDEKLEERLKPDSRRIDPDENDNNVNGVYILETRPGADFRYEAAKDRLSGLDLNTDGGTDMTFLTPEDKITMQSALGDGDGVVRGRQGQLMRLAGSIDMDSFVSIGCAGAVLSYLAKIRGAELLPDEAEAFEALQIRSLESFTLSDIMFVNADTLASLQIMEAENHPNKQMQGPHTSGSKESLSVFGLFSRFAKTPQGKQRLRQMFLRPSHNLDVIMERQQVIKVLLHNDNNAAFTTIMKSMSGIRDMRSVVLHLQKGARVRNSARKGIWGSLQAFSQSVVALVETMHDLRYGRGYPQIFASILQEVRIRDLQEVDELINDTVDFQMSEEKHRICVKQGVDMRLDELKHTYDGMESMLTHIMEAIVAELPEWARQYIHNCIFYPQLGFLMVVEVDEQTGQARYEGEGLDVDIWQPIFVSTNLGYFKTNRMSELDAQYGDMEGDIRDREIEIVQELADKVLVHSKLLVTASNLCGELDAMVALAHGAVQHHLQPPRLTTSNIIDIYEGRHILQERTVNTAFIPNDCTVVGGEGETEGEDERLDSLPLSSESSMVIGANQRQSMLMLTGPNYSGKSVYLKQNALIVYLAHIGSFVPATRALIGLTDRILTRIATRESVSRNQSAFMIDLQQIALSMSLATRRSLIIIDEFGKGTNSLDGAGLATGVFDHFLGLGKHSPRVLAATHFHEIFENGFLDDRPQLRLGHMAVDVDKEAAVLDQVVYLYKFTPERNMSSFGATCARLNGIDESIVARAEQLILLASRGEDLVDICSGQGVQKTQELEAAEFVARRFLAVDFDKTRRGARSLLNEFLAIEAV